MSNVHANTAEVLRMLAASPPAELAGALTDEAVKLVLRLAAEACEVDDAKQERDQAVMYAVEMRSLLGRVAALLDSLPLPAEGGAWETYALAEEVRRAVAVELPVAGRPSEDGHVSDSG